MKHYHFKENFFSASKSAIEVFNEQEEAVFLLRLFYTSNAQETFALFGHQKHNYEITNGQDKYRVIQEKTISGMVKTPFKTVWRVEKNDNEIGVFRTKFGMKPTMYFEGLKGDILKFQSGFFSRSVKVTEGNTEIMQTKSERFKIASQHDITIASESYHPAMLILLFQAFYEYQESQRKQAD